MTGANFSGGLDLDGPLLQVGASSTVSGGTLASSPLGVGTLTLSSGTLQDDGGGRTLATAVTFDGNVTLAGAGSTGVSFGPLGLTTPNVATMSNSPTITVTAPTTIADPIVGSTGFTKSGPSVLTLTASAGDNISGPITVNLGTLAGIGTLASPVTVNALASIAPGVNVSGNFGGVGAFTLGGLTLSNGAVADFDLGSSSDRLTVTGALELDGATLNVGNSGGLAAGTYELMSYGSLTGSFNGGSLLVGSLPAGFSAVVVNNPAGSQIDVNVYVPKVWAGIHGSAWDSSTVNWTVGGGTATYGNADAVLFDDTASTGSVSLAGTVSPTTMTVNNNSLPYAFSGTGTIAGGMMLNKQGSGTLAMNLANNTYNGGTNLSGGVLQLGANSTVSGGVLAAGPLGSGTVFLSSGTLQDDGAGRTLANAIRISGDVTLGSAGAGGLTFGPQGLSTPNTVTVVGAPTIDVTAPQPSPTKSPATRWSRRAPSTLTLTAATNTYAGPTVVNGGSLVGTVANIPTAITLANGGNVTFNQNSNATLNNRISGTGSLTKAGTAVLTLGAPNAYLGATAINAGTLRLTPPMPDPGLIVHYNMDGPPGAIANWATIPDSSPKGNNGTMVAPGASYVAGRFGQGIQLPAPRASRRRTRLPSTFTRGPTRCGSTCPPTAAAAPSAMNSSAGGMPTSPMAGRGGSMSFITSTAAATEVSTPRFPRWAAAGSPIAIFPPR